MGKNVQLCYFYRGYIIIDRKGRDIMIKNNKYPVIFIAPAIIIYIALFIIPTMSGFYYSLTNWHIDVHQIKFIGFENFKQMFSEDVLLVALKNTLIFAFLVTVFQNLLGMLLALALNVNLKTKALLRTVFYMPVVICPLIVGYIFTAILNPDFGLVNQFLRLCRLDFLAMDWLNDPRIALFSVIATEIWRVSGFAMIIYLAGLQTIPKELIDSSNIDGAGYWGRFRSVVFPLLAPSFTVNFLLSIIGSLKVFEIVFVLTRGGPGYTTEVFNTYIMRSFSQGTYGYATAVGLVLFLIISVLGLSVLVVLRKREVEI